MKKAHYNLARKIGAAHVDTPEQIETLAALSEQLAKAMGQPQPVVLDPEQFVIGTGVESRVPDGVAMYKSALKGAGE